MIGCDLHARQQTLAVLDTATGQVMEKTLTHSGSNVQEFYAALPGPVRVGIEATGTMQWFLSLMEELGIECQVGHPAKIRAAEPRKQKHDRRDADLILQLLVENRFPSIWRPSKELVDLRALLLHRHQWVRIWISRRVQECNNADHAEDVGAGHADCGRSVSVERDAISGQCTDGACERSGERR
jgi:hypothetical protein